jgi:hypothetical protein
MPTEPVQATILIDPWHFALALCEWIGHCSTRHRDEFLVNDFRNRESLRHESLHGVDLAVYRLSDELISPPRAEVNSFNPRSQADPEDERSSSPFLLYKEPCDVHVL